MQRLKVWLSKIFRIGKKPLVILPIVAIAVIVTVSFIVTQNNNRVSSAAQDKALAQLAAAQKALAKEQTASIPANKSDISDLTFTDISTATADKSTCGRLQNRPGVVITDSACDYKLRAFGEIDTAIVFVYDSGYSQITYNNLRSTDANDQKDLAYVNTFYAEQAKKYKVTNPVHLNMAYYGPYHVTSPVDNLYYYDNGGTLLQTYQATASANSVPENKYDIIEYVLLDGIYGGMAFPSLHQNFAYAQYEPGVFAHETLHLFGATDKYTSQHDVSCKADASSDPFNSGDASAVDNDIMCSDFTLSTASINPITAREIGWAN